MVRNHDILNWTPFFSYEHLIFFCLASLQFCTISIYVIRYIYIFSHTIIMSNNYCTVLNTLMLRVQVHIRLVWNIISLFSTLLVFQLALSICSWKLKINQVQTTILINQVSLYIIPVHFHDLKYQLLVVSQDKMSFKIRITLKCVCIVWQYLCEICTVVRYVRLLFRRRFSVDQSRDMTVLRMLRWQWQQLHTITPTTTIITRQPNLSTDLRGQIRNDWFITTDARDWMNINLDIEEPNTFTNDYTTAGPCPPKLNFVLGWVGMKFPINERKRIRRVRLGVHTHTHTHTTHAWHLSKHIAFGERGLLFPPTNAGRVRCHRVSETVLARYTILFDRSVHDRPSKFAANIHLVQRARRVKVG